MIIHYERIRTASVVRDYKGNYRIVYFAPISRERALALLPEYGIGVDEIVSIDEVAVTERIELRDGAIVPMLLAAFEMSPFTLGRSRSSLQQSAAPWVEAVLSRFIPHGARLCPLSKTLINEIITLINETQRKQ